MVSVPTEFEQRVNGITGLESLKIWLLTLGRVTARIDSWRKFGGAKWAHKRMHCMAIGAVLDVTADLRAPKTESQLPRLRSLARRGKIE